LPKSNLLPIDATVKSSHSGQVCTRFGVHQALPALRDMYDAGDAVFVTNVGPLSEDITKQEYQDGAKEIPSQLFAHNTQQHFIQNLDAESSSRNNGVLGRALDIFKGQGITTSSYSISGSGATVLTPESSQESYEVVGSDTITEMNTDSLPFLQSIINMTENRVVSPLQEQWAAAFENAILSTDSISSVLESTEPETSWTPDEDLDEQFLQVAKLIKANTQVFHKERQTFYVHIGGFDVHANTIDVTASKFDLINTAIANFKAEMIAQNLWTNVTIVQASEFGRTLTSNGVGSDHAWGGNTFIAGGSVRGGQILGDYPDDLTEYGSRNIGRGRLIPTTSWETVWDGIIEWFGVTATNDKNIVSPRRSYFQTMFTSSDMFE